VKLPGLAKCANPTRFRKSQHELFFERLLPVGDLDFPFDSISFLVNDFEQIRTHFKKVSSGAD